jgi:MFS family permease
MSNILKKPTFSALKYKEFRTYIIARFFFILVLTMQATLISWKVFEITKDPFSIGLIGLFEFFPAFLMAFYSGYIIDKSDKRKLLFFSFAANLLLTILFAYITSANAKTHLSDTIILGSIYGIAFASGIARAFSGPTSFALLGNLVPKEELSNAITWHSGSWQVAGVGGPALAGILYGVIGISFTFSLMIVMMIFAVVGAFLIKPKPLVKSILVESMLQNIREGFRFVWRTKEILGVLSLDLFAVFFGGATAMLPYFSDVILHTGPAGLGMLRSAPALGAVAMMVLINFIPMHKNQGKIMMYCVAGFGICIIVFGLSNLFWVSAVALFLSGLLDGISILVRSTVLQLKTPENMKGRVSSLNSIFIMSSNELGAFESGFMAKFLGVIPSVIFGGVMTVGVVVFTWIKIPSIKKITY